MKILKLLIFLALAAFMAGALFSACEKAPVSMTPTAIVNDLSAQKDQYVQDFQAKVDEYQVKIDDLKKKGETMSGTAKDELNQKIDMLTAKREEAKGKIEEIKAAGVDGWEAVKAQADATLTDLENLYDDALSLVK